MRKKVIAGIVLALLSLLLPACQDQPIITGPLNITLNYYDPFVIDQNTLPQPLPSVEAGQAAAEKFAAAWNAKDYGAMYDLLDPFLYKYHEKEVFSAMMQMNPRKYAADHVEVEKVSVMSYYQGQVNFRVTNKGAAAEEIMLMTFDENEKAAIYGFVDFFNANPFQFICGDIFNSTAASDLRTRQECAYELAYRTKLVHVCNSIPNIILDHGECFNIRASASAFNNLCDAYPTCYGIVGYTTNNESLCSFRYDKDIKRCNDGWQLAEKRAKGAAGWDGDALGNKQDNTTLLERRTWGS
ncbi:hypothetical protein HYU19_00140 [Candidatus Woesearchaeota archaeon]|nr:hypothetical protein [Candidatus Woesearchaeota archaeon]